MKKCVLVSVLCVCFVGVGFAYTQAPADAAVKFGLGFQSTFPTFGMSVVADLDRNVSLQGVLGFVADLKSYSARLLYRFDVKPLYNLYGYGQVGIWSYAPAYAPVADSTFGFGAGVGVEYNWQSMSPDLPPVWFNVEMGFGYVKFNEGIYDVALIDVGVGIHYRF